LVEKHKVLIPNSRDELKDEFKGITLGEEFFNTSDGEVFRLTVIGRITLFFEEYGL